MQQYFATIFEDVKDERSPILLLRLFEPEILKQSRFTDHEIAIIKKSALENLHRKRDLKEIIAFGLLEKQFSD